VPPEAGTVVASFGRRCLIEDAQGTRHRAIPRGKRLRIVCGDEVSWVPGQQPGDDGLVIDVLPRRNALERPNMRGRNEVLAANLTRIVVLVAPTPPPDPFLIDRYLAQAELMGCEAIIVRSKLDLPAEAPLQRALEEWAAAGYTVLEVAARGGDGIEVLSSRLEHGVSILVGQSGVGKSSLLNALSPSLELATGALSDSSGEGRHTTTAAVRHTLANGGHVIDSPGVRDYAPGLVAPRDVARGYREINALAAHCRFADCMHLKEPDCAVRQATDRGRIAPRRYESYRRLVRLMETLPPTPR
jgi:ribosome biogenesis GTPase